MIVISAIICTHNRCDLLPKAIASLQGQSLSKSSYEIIVVDNASTDETEAVCNTFSSLENFRYIYEPVPGLSVARNRGLVEARGKYVAYMDDDAIACTDWLALLHQAFTTVQPTPVSVGGKIFPLWEAEKPSWFPDEKKPYLTILDYGDSPQFILYPRILYGTNMSFEKEALLRHDGFRTDVGRRKGNLLSCEESDIYQKLAKKELPVYYLPQASVQHLVPRDRLSKKWLYRRHYWQGRSEVLLLPENLKKERVFSEVVTAAKDAVAALRFLLVPQSPRTRCIQATLVYTAIGKMQQLAIHLLKNAREKKKELLVIARTLPRMDRGSGHLRLYSILELLAPEYAVTFVADSLSNSTECNDATYVDQLERLGIEVYTDSCAFEEELAKRSFDIVIFEFYDVARKYLSSVQRTQPFAFTVIDSVDVHFARESQMADVLKDPELHRQAEATKANELEAYKLADLVWAVTESDKNILLDENSRMDIDVIPNIHKTTQVRRDKVKPNNLLFVGNFLHQPNVDAAIFFCTEILQRIKEEVPDTTVTIVGNAPTDAVRMLASDTVTVTGWVPDVTPFLETCHVAVVPLRYGAGMKGKVGEAMAAGVPVVTTSIGVQGIDVVSGCQLVVADTPLDFARATIEVLKSDALASRLSTNAFQYMHRFTPDNTWKDLFRSLAKASADKGDRILFKLFQHLKRKMAAPVSDPPPQVKYPVNANLDDKVLFLGYDITAPEVRAGEPFKITYYWQCLDTISNTYASFVHFTNDRGDILFQNDHGMTSSWEIGRVYRDSQVVAVPSSVTGEVQLRLGLWSPRTNQKIPVVSPGGAELDSDGRMITGIFQIA